MVILDVSSDELRQLNADIHASLTATVRDAQLFAAQFNKYAFLWEQQLDHVLQATLRVAREKEAVAGKGYAIMEAFKMQVSHRIYLHIFKFVCVYMEILSSLLDINKEEEEPRLSTHKIGAQKAFNLYYSSQIRILCVCVFVRK